MEWHRGTSIKDLRCLDWMFRKIDLLLLLEYCTIKMNDSADCIQIYTNDLKNPPCYNYVHMLLICNSDLRSLSKLDRRVSLSNRSVKSQGGGIPSQLTFEIFTMIMIFLPTLTKCSSFPTLTMTQGYGCIFFVLVRRKSLCPWLRVGLRVNCWGTMFLLILSKATFIGYHLQGGGVWLCGLAKERLLIKQSSLSTCGQWSSSPTLVLQD